jgi:hypothetical protein
MQMIVAKTPKMNSKSLMAASQRFIRPNIRAYLIEGLIRIKTYEARRIAANIAKLPDLLARKLLIQRRLRFIW